MKPFRERNPVPIGAIGLAVILGMLVLAFNASRLPFLNGGNTYHAAFADRAGEIDTQQLAEAFDTLATTFKDPPPYVHDSLRGLERLSTSIASRDNELHALLARANGVTQTLASRDAQ